MVIDFLLRYIDDILISIPSFSKFSDIYESVP